MLNILLMDSLEESLRVLGKNRVGDVGHVSSIESIIQSHRAKISFMSIHQNFEQTTTTSHDYQRSLTKSISGSKTKVK